MEDTGTFDIPDPETGVVRNLILVKIREHVDKTGDHYYSWADFTDTNTGELLGLDLYVGDNDGKLGVVDVRIRELASKESHAYEENDNSVSVEE